MRIFAAEVRGAAARDSAKALRHRCVSAETAFTSSDFRLPSRATASYHMRQPTSMPEIVKLTEPCLADRLVRVLEKHNAQRAVDQKRQGYNMPVKDSSASECICVTIPQSVAICHPGTAKKLMYVQWQWPLVAG